MVGRRHPLSAQYDQRAGQSGPENCRRHQPVDYTESGDVAFAGKNIARLFSFIAILWQLSGVHTLHLSDGYTITIHGYLVWTALGYAALSSVLAHLFGRHLHGLNVAQQHAEAEYRATLLRIREHGEQIAFYRGEEAEHVRMQQRFLAITKTGAT